MGAHTSRPNVIFVLTDDQGYGDLSCLGNPVLETPAIDRLYRESVRCTDFHVCPVCTPTRGELMTGRDAMANCATFVCMGRSLLRSDLPTMADLFAASGYHTGHFGKWHLGDNYPYRPQDRGFHESIYHPGWGITSAPDFFGNDYFDDHYRHRDEIEEYRGYCTDVWFREAQSWIEGCRRRDEPFFAYIATNAPHGPLWVPDLYRDPYRGRVGTDETSFFGMIANIDENLGRLDSYLAESGLRENTILIFMTDNGTATGDTVYGAGMRGKKKSLYDGGHRVPWFTRWPDGGIEGGRDVGGLTRSTDLLPTLIDLCRLDNRNNVEFDGMSLASHLRNGSRVDSARMAAVQFGHANEGIWGYAPKHAAAVLFDRWRLVNGDELYDLSTDPLQERNVAESYADVADRMRGFYDEWWDGVRDNVDRYLPLTIGHPAENPMRLSSADWAWVYADNPESIRGCVMDSGTWHVEAARPGAYELTLRRWPEESGLGITAGAPVLEGVDGTIQAGRPLPVASAWVGAGGREASGRVEPDASEARFTLNLDAGPSTISSWWIDSDGNRLAGAYYLTVERLDR